MKDVRILLGHLEGVKATAQLSGVAVVRSFIKQRIQPIKERDHPTYEYSGWKDPTRESPNLWVPKDLDAQVSSLFQKDVVVKDILLPEGYELECPPDQVSALTELCLLLLPDQIYLSRLFRSGDMSYFCFPSSSSQRGSAG